MKKSVCLILCVAMLISCLVTTASAEVDVQYMPSALNMGDVNSDGSINGKDVLLLRKYIVGLDSSLTYENADLTGDCLINGKDVLSIRKYIVGLDVEISSVFAMGDIDITSEVEDLGFLYKSIWANPDTHREEDTAPGIERVLARNPYDMVSYNGMVVASCGNYNTNQGPVYLYYVTRDSEKKKGMGNSFRTEQINKFYIYDDTLFALAADPNAWCIGEFYMYVKNSRGKYEWHTINTLKDNIHCYDMIKYDGEYFFCGSNVNYIDGYERSMGTVFRFDGDDMLNSTQDDYTVVPFINKHGNVISYTDEQGVPRVYEFCEYKGELYAYYRDPYIKYYDQYYNYNGIYKYNKLTKQFEYCVGMSLDIPFEAAFYSQDVEGYMRDFEWNGKYVSVNFGLFLTEDFVNWEERSIEGYEDYVIRDCELIGDKLYVLATVENEEGHYTNAVFETEDLVNFRRVVHFDTLGYVRSFTYCDGAFFFCIGTDPLNVNTEAGLECGRMYRYLYYK